MALRTVYEMHKRLFSETELKGVNSMCIAEQLCLKKKNTVRMKMSSSLFKIENKTKLVE